jgi:hypothetical protein
MAKHVHGCLFRYSHTLEKSKEARIIIDGVFATD